MPSFPLAQSDANPARRDSVDHLGKTRVHLRSRCDRSQCQILMQSSLEIDPLVPGIGHPRRDPECPRLSSRRGGCAGATASSIIQRTRPSAATAPEARTRCVWLPSCGAAPPSGRTEAAVLTACATRLLMDPPARSARRGTLDVSAGQVRLRQPSRVPLARLLLLLAHRQQSRTPIWPGAQALCARWWASTSTRQMPHHAVGSNPDLRRIYLAQHEAAACPERAVATVPNRLAEGLAGKTRSCPPTPSPGRGHQGGLPRRRRAGAEYLDSLGGAISSSVPPRVHGTSPYRYLHRHCFWRLLRRVDL